MKPDGRLKVFVYRPCVGSPSCPDGCGSLTFSSSWTFDTMQNVQLFCRQNGLLFVSGDGMDFSEHAPWTTHQDNAIAYAQRKADLAKFEVPSQKSGWPLEAFLGDR
jgi:hypothetical protein